MTESTATRVASQYHERWTSGDFEGAIALLHEEVVVEVPVNDYPTRATFGGALAAFGAMVERVELLSVLGDDGEAMLLYDLRVSVVGALRIAEHFTVRDGRVVRLRQIHDTFAVRGAGLAS